MKPGLYRAIPLEFIWRFASWYAMHTVAYYILTHMHIIEMGIGAQTWIVERLVSWYSSTTVDGYQAVVIYHTGTRRRKNKPGRLYYEHKNPELRINSEWIEPSIQKTVLQWWLPYWMGNISNYCPGWRRWISENILYLDGHFVIEGTEYRNDESILKQVRVIAPIASFIERHTFLLRQTVRALSRL